MTPGRAYAGGVCGAVSIEAVGLTLKFFFAQALQYRVSAGTSVPQPVQCEPKLRTVRELLVVFIGVREVEGFEVVDQRIDAQREPPHLMHGERLGK